MLLKLNNPTFINNNKIEYYENSNKLAIIIDPRFDEVMEAVIRNFLFFMNPHGWNLMILSYSKYKDIIKEKFPNCIFRSIKDDVIEFDEINIPNISIDTYNKILLSKTFWSSLPANNIVIFQKDCIMYKMFDNFFENMYHFSGANYYRPEDSSFYFGGINGGFSIRNRNAMIECIEKITWEKIEEYRKYMFKTHDIKEKDIQNKNEDVFFTHACEMLLKSVPDKFNRSLLAIEVDLNIQTCVFHGWQWSYHNIDFAKAILLQSPLFSRFIHT